MLVVSAFARLLKVRLPLLPPRPKPGLRVVPFCCGISTFLRLCSFTCCGTLCRLCSSPFVRLSKGIRLPVYECFHFFLQLVVENTYTEFKRYLDLPPSSSPPSLVVSYPVALLKLLFYSCIMVERRPSPTMPWKKSSPAETFSSAEEQNENQPTSNQRTKQQNSKIFLLSLYPAWVSGFSASCAMCDCALRSALHCSTHV